MAVFQDFKWDQKVREKDGSIAEFKKINIFYGRNYSGKTTASRIIRAIKRGEISSKYVLPEFDVEFNDGSHINQSDLSSHDHTIRVFNEDFVKENLKFIVNDEEDVNSFAILGDDKIRLEREIEQKETELGSEEEKQGLLWETFQKKADFGAAEALVSKTQNELDSKLRDKANKKPHGIKHNTLYGDPNYRINNIKDDIKLILNQAYKQIDEEQVDKLKEILKEEAKPTIQETQELNLKFSTLAKTTQELVERKIALSDPIQELLDDAVLQEWVRKGIKTHKDKRETCGFCGSLLPPDLWDKLDKHFNKESEDLRKKIENQVTLIESEIERSPVLFFIDKSHFYSTFSEQLDELSASLKNASATYQASLKELKNILKFRLQDIFTPIDFKEPEDVTSKLDEIRTQYETYRVESNEFTSSLQTKQNEAKTKLRLQEVSTFINDIKFKEELQKIKALAEKAKNSKKIKDEFENKAKDLKQSIKELKDQLKDEDKGAKHVNQYLNDFFGHGSLQLEAVEGEEGYRFEIRRNGNKAYHLSEGECSLIAFCYFMAKLDDVDTKGNQPIIWIDDPISSLDSNHIFFLYSLINSVIIKSGSFNQLFISTHNLDFLKYLKRIHPKDPDGISYERKYFIFEKDSSGGIITLMPDYLKKYVTEFNYLFHQIYKCACADTTNDENHSCYYNFGNNARKFLEALLYYKYPNKYSLDDKLSRFFDDNDIGVSVTNRINNELSHLECLFERSMTPIDIPEMKKTAEFILEKMKEKDPEQHDALLESIGELQLETENA